MAGVKTRNVVKRRLEILEKTQRQGIDNFAKDIHVLYQNQQELAAAMDEMDITLAALLAILTARFGKDGLTQDAINDMKQRVRAMKDAQIEEMKKAAEAEREVAIQQAELAALSGETPAIPDGAFIFGG